jgi:hypothetical protein
MPKGVYPRVPAEQRFLAKVNKLGPYPKKGTLAFGSGRCWLWTASISGKYGSFSNGLAHRFSYELHGGVLIDGMDIDHRCRNRLCVNPEHLEQVDRKENLRRSTNFIADHMRATHCSKGHEFTPENTYVRPSSGRSGRNCKACARIYTRDYMRRQRLAGSKLL